MLTSIERVYQNGQIELAELPDNIPEETKVIVTFIRSDGINLRSHGIDQIQAEVLQANLSTFADDWSNPEMAIYDNYDAAKASG